MRDEQALCGYINDELVCSFCIPLFDKSCESPKTCDKLSVGLITLFLVSSDGKQCTEAP
jgi:hypothetical protein